MNFDIQRIASRDAYKLLTGVVVPRPIALVTSLDENGVLNAAPFSYFNLVGSNPPLVVLGLANKAPNEIKDTGRNIRHQREWVVNMISRSMVEAMNICAVDFPAGISEVEAAHLETAPSQLVSVPRLAVTPAALECREHATHLIGDNRVVIGEVVALYIADEFVDVQKMHVDTPALNLIGRMGGGGGYTETSGTFELARVTFEEWQQKKGNAPS